MCLPFRIDQADNPPVRDALSQTTRGKQMVHGIEHSRALALAIAVCVAAGTAAAGEPKNKPVIKISRETTCLTGPLRKDGRVDYLAALNTRYGKGVTPQNNAVVGIIEALGAQGLHKKTRAATLKALGVTLPAGKQFPRLPQVRFEALDGPWKKTDHPDLGKLAELAKWLEANGRAMDLVVKASRRSRFFVPAIPKTPDGTLWDTIESRISLAVHGMHVQNLLLARAGLRMGRNATDAAIVDIVAAHRLGALQCRAPLLTGRMLGTATAVQASKTTVALVKSADLSSKQVREILRALAQLPAQFPLAEVMDVGERWHTLDYNVALADGDLPDAYLQKLVTMASHFAKEKAWTSFVISVLMSRRHMAQVDWTAFLTAAMTEHDKMVKALRQPTFAARKNAFRLYDARTALSISQAKAAWVKMGKPASADKMPLSAVNATWLADALSSLNTWISLTRMLETFDMRTGERSLCKLAVALAGYRVEHGTYPRKLSALKPRWLKTIPKDVCSGKGFIYKPSGKAYVLYSVGRNMRNDGGRERPDDAKDNYDGPDDIVIRVRAK